MRRSKRIAASVFVVAMSVLFVGCSVVDGPDRYVMVAKMKGIGWDYDQDSTVIRGDVEAGGLWDIAGYGFFYDKLEDLKGNLEAIPIRLGRGGFYLGDARWVRMRCDRLIIKGAFMYLCNEESASRLEEDEALLRRFLERDDMPESEFAITFRFRADGKLVARIECSGYVAPYAKIEILDPRYELWGFREDERVRVDGTTHFIDGVNCFHGLGRFATFVRRIGQQ